MANSPTVLVGAGGHAKSVRAVMRENPARLVVAGEDESFLAGYAGDPVVVTVGYVGEGNPAESVRRRVIDLYERHGVLFGTVVAASAIVAEDVRIEAGAVVLNRAVVNAGACIGRHAVVNTGALIEHDVILNENVNVAPGAIVLGGATLGDNVFIGAGAIVRQGVRIAANVVVGMGAVVTQDITEHGTYVGNPARRIR